MANVTSILPINHPSLLQKKAAFARSCGYNPHTVQRRIHNSTARFRVAAGGSRSGKSMAGGFEGAFALSLADRHLWYVSAVYDLADKEFDWTFEFLARAGLMDYAKTSNPGRGSRKIEMPWGSWAETKSTQKPESLLGEELDLLILGEASQMALHIWERQLRRALGSRHGAMIALSTPNWDSGFFRMIFDQGASQDEEFADYESWQFSVLANPYFSREEYDLAVATLPAEVVAEQYDGKFTSRRGQVFPQFDPKRHVIQQAELPAGIENWPVFRSVHWEKNAFNSPFICLWIACDATSRQFIVIDEMYNTKTTKEEAAREIHRRSKGMKIITTMGDFFNRSLSNDLKNLQIRIQVNADEKKYSKKHCVVRRLQAVQTALMRDRGVFVANNCTSLINELAQCRWPEPKRDSLDAPETELPPMKYMGGPSALSHIIAFSELASGCDIYSASPKAFQRKEGA